MTRIFATANQKGGVGKTTTTMHLAGAASRQGMHTLIIDADPQGNMTSALAPQVTDEHAGLADVLSSNAPDFQSMADAAVTSQWERVDLVPTAGVALAAVQKELATRPLGGNHVMREALAPVRGQYDLILIDCPPSLDALSVNAFTAADSLVLVTDAGKFGGEGILQLVNTMRDVRRYCDRADLTIAGAIFNGYNPHQNEQRSWYREISAVLEKMEIPEIFPPIPRRITLQACTGSGTRLDLSKDSRAAELVKVFDRHLDTLLAAR